MENKEENKRKKVVIVGGGMAGLTAASYLSKDKYDVVLLEKNDRTGGLVSTFKRDGFCFDSGPRAFVNSGMVKPILRELGVDFEERKNRISITLGEETIYIESMDSLERYKQILLTMYPDDEKNIYKIFKKIYKLSKYTQVLYQYDNPYFMDDHMDRKFLMKEYLPWLIKLIWTIKKFSKYHISMEEFLAKETKNQALIDMLTQFFFAKTPAYFALGYFPVWLDYFYPKKGTGEIPKRMEKKIIERGGIINFHSEVEKVIPKESKVLVRGGEAYTYDYLIWAADLKSMYKGFDLTGMEKSLSQKVKEKSKEINSSKPAESAYTMYIGVNRPPSYFENICGEHSFYTKSKMGLGQINKQRREELLDDFEKYSREDVFDWLDDFCNLNTYEISIPVLRDENLAPAGKTGVMISCLIDYEIVKRVEEAGYIDEFKNSFEDRIIKLFSDSFFHNFEKDIIFRFSSTPLTINKVTGSANGSIVGWSFETKSPVSSGFKDLSKASKTIIPNIFQAGQWAYAPAGVPIAMVTGWLATKEIKKR